MDQTAISTEADNASICSEAEEKNASVNSGRWVTVAELIQHIFTLGVCSLAAWEQMIDGLKKCNEIKISPSTMTILFDLTNFYNTLDYAIFLNTQDLSQEKVPALKNQNKSIEEIFNILKPIMNKKPCKGKLYCESAVSTILKVINSIFAEEQAENEHVLHDPPSSNKNKRKHHQQKIKESKRRKRSSSVSSLSSSSSSGSSSHSQSYSSYNDSDNDSDFESLFVVSNKQPIVISQEFQCLKKNKRIKLVSPGEQGSHLIKIEITRTSDLKSCNVKNYWQKVSSKGLFLLDTVNKDDKDVLKTLKDTLKTYGKKVRKIKNIKTIAYDQKTTKHLN